MLCLQMQVLDRGSFTSSAGALLLPPSHVIFFRVMSSAITAPAYSKSGHIAVSPKTIPVPEINYCYFPTYLLSTAFCSKIGAFTACDCTTALLSLWEDYNCSERCFSPLSDGVRAQKSTWECVCMHVYLLERES